MTRSHRHSLIKQAGLVAFGAIYTVQEGIYWEFLHTFHDKLGYDVDISSLDILVAFARIALPGYRYHELSNRRY